MLKISIANHLSICWALDIFQKRKHEGMEDSADVHKHKKSKVAHTAIMILAGIANFLIE